MARLTADQKAEAIELYKEWTEASMEEADAASRAATAYSALEDLGIDPEEPPAWLV